MYAIITIAVLLSLVCAQTTNREKAGLVAIYNSTGGANWRSGWDINTDPCINSWFGVKCRPIGNNQYNVWSLVLQGNNLAGTLPTEVGLLTNMQFFYLSGNNIFGTVPTETGLMTQLVQIGLDKNQFTGGVPSTWSALGGLQIVYFQENLFTGPLDALATLPAIQYLWFGNNKLQGTIPNALGEIFTLQQIGINDNELTGTVPSGFGLKQNLFQAFYAQNNKLTGAFPKNLCPTPTCDLSGNTFTCPLPSPTCCHIATCTPPPPTDEEY